MDRFAVSTSPLLSPALGTWGACALPAVLRLNLLLERIAPRTAAKDRAGWSGCDRRAGARQPAGLCPAVPGLELAVPRGGGGEKEMR